MPMEYNLLIAGVVLLFIEMLIPGFGVFGVLGLCSLSVGSFFVMGGGMEACHLCSAGCHCVFLFSL